MKVTYQAQGITDEITTCEHCGKAGLKSTVRLLILDSDGEDGEIYAGVTCAARLSGRKAAAIRTEAAQATRTRRQAASDTRAAWDHKRVLWMNPLQEKAIGRWAKPAEIRAWYASEEYQTANAAWLAENPEPPQPWTVK